MKRGFSFCLALASLCLLSFIFQEQKKIKVWMIGDSKMAN
jgi:hypothetical protein